MSDSTIKELAAYMQAAILIWQRQGGIEEVQRHAATFRTLDLPGELGTFARAVAALYVSSQPKAPRLELGGDSPAVEQLRELAKLRAIDCTAAELGASFFTLAPVILAELDAARDAARDAQCEPRCHCGICEIARVAVENARADALGHVRLFTAEELGAK
jgi:hypothetical protein